MPGIGVCVGTGVDVGACVYVGVGGKGVGFGVAHVARRNNAAQMPDLRSKSLT